MSKYLSENKKLVNIDQFQVEDEIKDFYHKNTLKEILLAKKFLLEENKNMKINVNSYIWSCTAHILHGNRPYALSRRSHNIIPIPPKGKKIYKSLIKSLKEKVIRTYSKNLNEIYLQGDAKRQSVLNLNLESESIDAIITSPPFLGTTEFLRQNRMRLWFAGWSYNYQVKLKKSFLEYEKSLSVYDNIIKEFERILKPNGLVILHLGVVKNVDMAETILPYAERNNFKKLDLVYEDAKKLENHGRTDRGSTHTHQFLFLNKS